MIGIHYIRTIKIILNCLFPLLLLNKKYIDHSTLYSIKAPFELLHGDIDNMIFFSKSAFDLKYFQLIVDLFTSKTYIYPTKSKNLLLKKMANFYINILEK